MGINKVWGLLAAQDDALLKMMVASGRQPTKDAGKYKMCANIPNSRYFLVYLKGRLSTMATSMEWIDMAFGLCLPDICSNADAEIFFKSDMKDVLSPDLQLLEVEEVSAKSPSLDLATPSAGNKVWWVLVGLNVAWVVMATVYYLYRRYGTPPVQVAANELLEGSAEQSSSAPPEPRLPLVVQAFSLFGSNGTLSKLVEPCAYRPTDNLNGVRVISMLWIIMGHTFLMPEGISGYNNEQDIHMTQLNHDAAENDPLFFLIVSAQIGVDTFFFLSGFLFSYLTVKELRRNARRFNKAQALVLRYIRLTPPFALAMVMFYQIWPYFASGPFGWKFQHSIYRRCDGSWWSEMLYLMNFLPFNSDDVCMGWTWYLGNDMFFFIVTLFILPLYHRSKKIGWGCVIGLTLLSFGITTWLVVEHHLSVYLFDHHNTDYSYWAYSKPYCRIPAYFVGVGVGWLLLDMEDAGFTRDNMPKTRSAHVKASIAAAFSFLIMAVIVFLPWTDHGYHANSWGDAMSVFYIVFTRPIWALCCAAISLLCFYGYLPQLDRFLAHPMWLAPTRLTFGTYLAHPMIIKLAAGTSINFYTFSGMGVFYRFVGNTLAAYSLSLVFWIMMERPVMTFTSAMLKGGARQARPAPKVVDADLEPIPATART